MFKFNFDVDEDNISSNPSFEDHPTDIIDIPIRDPLCHEFPLKTAHMPAICGDVDLLFGEVRVKKLLFSAEVYAAQSDDGNNGPTDFALKINQTDLAPGDYEGGFKLWECGEDLAGYLHEITAETPDFWKNKNVCELGCGHSLPSLYCLQREAAEIAFQDYNVEVLEQLTSPAIEANMANQSTKIELFSGDWSLLANTMKESQYDVILSSDTIYSKANHQSFLKLIKYLLKPNGVAYIASKVYYFGVGGGVEEFRKEVEKEEKLESSISKTFDDGKSNLRQIVKILFK